MEASSPVASISLPQLRSASEGSPSSVEVSPSSPYRITRRQRESRTSDTNLHVQTGTPLIFQDDEYEKLSETSASSPPARGPRLSDFGAIDVQSPTAPVAASKPLSAATSPVPLESHKDAARISQQVVTHRDSVEVDALRIGDLSSPVAKVGGTGTNNSNALRKSISSKAISSSESILPLLQRSQSPSISTPLDRRKAGRAPEQLQGKSPQISRPSVVHPKEENDRSNYDEISTGSHRKTAGSPHISSGSVERMYFRGRRLSLVEVTPSSAGRKSGFAGSSSVPVDAATESQRVAILEDMVHRLSREVQVMRHRMAHIDAEIFEHVQKMREEFEDQLEDRVQEALMKVKYEYPSRPRRSSELTEEAAKAIENGDLQLLQRLCASGQPLDGCDLEGRMAICHVDGQSSDAFDMLDYLVSRGAPVDVREYVLQTEWNRITWPVVEYLHTVRVVFPRAAGNTSKVPALVHRSQNFQLVAENGANFVLESLENDAELPAPYSIFMYGETVDVVSVATVLRNTQLRCARSPQIVGIHTLILDGVGMDSEAMSVLCPSLPTSLELLWLSNNAFGPEGAAALADVLPSLFALKAMYLNATELGDEGAVSVWRSLPLSVSEVAMCENGIGSQAIRSIFVGGELRSKDKERTQNSDADADDPSAMDDFISSFASSTSSLRASSTRGRMRNLRSLYLSRNAFGDDGADALLTSLRRFPGLRVLDIQDNALSPQKRTELSECIMHLDVFVV